MARSRSTSPSCPTGSRPADGVTYVRLELGWAGADEAAARGWAERLVGQLGER
ncbi:hypothetical protein [Actinophytocola sp.]|uniref:hypothetical protein n=1 Tax=Actinophytocola sp. TaxID=1872138 RepID=UPI002D623C2F|nr:hypothetical protein [Actinophytocola sp.]HYQ64773.1 hypothetical protein [Actinophytocola sp.]